jgi:hypothetical protein
LQYQWQRNGQNIVGAVTASYVTPALSLSDGGAQYGVTITNGSGSVTSSTAQLTVKAIPPALVAGPAPQIVNDGSSVTFNVTVTGSRPLSYQWLRNGQPILGANGDTLNLDKAELSDSGASYSVKVSNPGGDLTSSAALLTVKPTPLAVTQSPASVSVSDGSTTTLTVAATGSGPLSYQWLLNGVSIDGATASSYSLTVTLADSGKQFAVKISNPYGSLSSDAATLTVVAAAPQPSQTLKTIVAKVGEPLVASVLPGGTPPFSYQWERSDDGGASWQTVAGATASDFRVEKANLAWANAQLRARVTNAVGSVASNPVWVNVQPQLRILAGDTGGLGYVDGVGSDARFTGSSNRVAIGKDGVIYVVDSSTCVIRAVRLDGSTAKVSGTPGQCYEVQPPTANTPGSLVATAVLALPDAIGIDSQGRFIYSSEYGGIYRVRSDEPPERLDLVPNAVPFDASHDLLVDADDSILFLDSNGYNLYRLTPQKDLALLIDAKRQWAPALQLHGLALDSHRNIYFSTGNQIWRLEAKTNVLSRWLGSGAYNCPEYGPKLNVCNNGGISNLAFDPQDNLYFWNGIGTVNKVDAQGNVSWFSGVPGFYNSEIDGVAGTAVINNVSNLAWHPAGYLVLGSANGTIRKIDAQGTVQTLAGKARYYSNVTVYGSGTDARFVPDKLIADPNGLALMTGYGRVTLQIDKAGMVSGADSPQSSGIQQWTRMGDGTLLYIWNDRLYRQEKTGAATWLAGGGSMKPCSYEGQRGIEISFSGDQLAGMVTDADDNLVIADRLCTRLWKLDLKTNQVSTLTGQTRGGGGCGLADADFSTLGICGLASIARDRKGNIAFAQDSGQIRTVQRDGSVKTLVNGHDGATYPAQFRYVTDAIFQPPASMAFDDEGNLFVPDPGGARIRKISPSGYTSTVMGDGIQALRPGLNGSIGRPFRLITLPGNRLLFASESAIVTDGP